MLKTQKNKKYKKTQKNAKKRKKCKFYSKKILEKNVEIKKNLNTQKTEKNTKNAKNEKIIEFGLCYSTCYWLYMYL